MNEQWLPAETARAAHGLSIFSAAALPAHTQHKTAVSAHTLTCFAEQITYTSII